MSGKGKDGPRVGYFDEDVALTQKLTRPKLPPLEKPSVESAPPLRPKEGGAVDAEALRRIRRISGSNHVAVRVPVEPPQSAADHTVARAGPLPVEAYPYSEAAPSTIPEDPEESTQRHRLGSFEDTTQRLVADSEEAETTEVQRDSMVTRQVPPDVARRLLGQISTIEQQQIRESMGVQSRRPDPVERPRAPVAQQPAPAAQRGPAPGPAPAAQRGPAPGSPGFAPGPTDTRDPGKTLDASEYADDNRDPAQTLASLPKVVKELPQFNTLPLGSSSDQLGGPLPAPRELAPSPPAPVAPSSGSGSMPTVPKSSAPASTLPLGSGVSVPLPALPQPAPAPPSAAPLSASGGRPAYASSGAVPLASSGSLPSLAASGSLPSLAASGSVPAFSSSGSGPAFSPPGVAPALGSSGSVPAYASSGAVPAAQPQGAPRPTRTLQEASVPPTPEGPGSLSSTTSGTPARRRSRLWLWLLLAHFLAALAGGTGAWFKAGKRLPWRARPPVAG